ncbi:DUF499 domain-containing protein [Candidatus Poriferisodalis sp.]|uniref:DUF499 domain-containing protein n=1 Tax=Candidatus Poriferisodalis sp. TaxID=3101277 RepID=UPI003B0274AB
MTSPASTTAASTPWWQTVKLRPEVEAAHGNIDDVQASLHDAVFGGSSGRSHYADPTYYGQITYPTGSLVGLMAKIAVRLGAQGEPAKRARALWRLDQAMGGGKSHGLIGLWHLASNPADFATTDLGAAVLVQAKEVAGSEALASDLSNPRCIVLDCDNPAPREAHDGPARTLGERFLWRLFEGAYKKYEHYKTQLPNKEAIEAALADTGRPVLILIDEIMDYIRWVSNQSEQRALDDMAFLRALLDAVNDVDNCAAVLVMIASEKDRIALNETGAKCRAELEDLLIRNGEATTVTSGGDFADIIRRRLLDGPPPREVTDRCAEWIASEMRGRWSEHAFDKLSWASAGSGADFAEAVGRCYPFHPSLIELAENEWSQQAGFQRVRSTLQVFAATVYEQHRRGHSGDWAPTLIGPGDLPMSSRAVRDALLDSGLVSDQRTQSSLREICAGDIVDPDHVDRGTARLADLRRSGTGWEQLNPRAAERMATALFVYSLSPRSQGRRGATEAELMAASFVPSKAFGHGDAEVVWQELCHPTDGLAAIDSTAGSGKQPKRWHIETRQTLNMLVRREREAVTDAERDERVSRAAFEGANSGPFDAVLPVEGDFDAVPELAELRELLGGAGIDQARKCRLVVLDSRWFSLLNGADVPTRLAAESAMGLGTEALPMTWASSAVFAVINTQSRRQARNLAADVIAWERTWALAAVQQDVEMSKSAGGQSRETQRRFESLVKKAYSHVLYLAEGPDGRVMRDIRFQSENQSALDGSVVWSALQEAGKTFTAGDLDRQALMHNLRTNDWNRPLCEIRDDFWKAPRLPLLPGGEGDLRRALFEAVSGGDIEIVDSDDQVRQVANEGHLNLGSTDLRIRRPAQESTDDPDADDPPSVIDPPIVPDLPDDPPAPRRTEFRVSASVTQSLRDDGSPRDAVRQFLLAVANAVDDDAVHIQASLKITAGTVTKDKLIDAAQAAGIHFDAAES